MRYQLRTTRRAGFTLIELIVVMSIIVIIASLTLGAVSKGFGWVKQKNTEQTMTKVVLRLQRVIDRLYKEADDWPSATEAKILDEANGSFERARVLKVLYLYKWTFPNTYGEAFHNVQESRILYDANGYPPARALLGKLRSNYSVIPDPFNPLILPTQQWDAATPTTPGNTALDIPWQSSACMLAAYTTANGSPDDFSSDEVVVTDLPVGISGNKTDGNPKLVDAWGTPFLFLRHGNFAYSGQRLGTAMPGAAQPAWTMGLAKPAATPSLQFAPIEWILNPAANQPPIASTLDLTSYAYEQLQTRANTAFSSLKGKDAFDPTGLLRGINNQWRTSAASAGDWLNLPWLAVATATQHGNWFRSQFGYSPEPADQFVPPAGVVRLPNQAFTPMVIISAGGDKLFNQWDDNLDSYRLQINVNGQQ